MKLKHKLKDIKYSIRWAYQRVVRGYDDRALWDIDYWFRDMIIPMLEWHRDNRCYVLRDADTNEDLSHEKANQIFDRMIYHIKYSDPDSLLDKWGIGYNFTKEDLIKASNTAEENKNIFFETFSKYYYQLWD